METASALLIFGLCGIVGVLVDVDHALALILWRTVAPGIVEGRIWHTPVFILACIGICCLVSHITGLYPKLVLGGILTVTAAVLVYSPLVIWSWYG